MNIRPLCELDLEDIVRIDERLSGRSRPNHWESRITYAIRRDAEGSWVADQDDRVIGFLIADVRGEEFGFSSPTGWLEVLAVHPDHLRQDIASALVAQVTRRFQVQGVLDVRTLVGEAHPELKRFFESAGFTAEPVVVLHKNLDARRA